MNNEKTYAAVRFIQNKQYDLSKVYFYEISAELSEKFDYVIGKNYTNGMEFYPKFYNIAANNRTYNNPVMITKIYKVDNSSEKTFCDYYPRFFERNVVPITGIELVSLSESPGYPCLTLEKFYNTIAYKTTAKGNFDILADFEMKTVPTEFWINEKKYDRLPLIPEKKTTNLKKIEALSIAYDSSESIIENHTIFKEGKNNMFENMFKNVKIGKAENVEMSIYGPAFSSADGAKLAFNKNNESWVDVSGMTLDFSMAYMLPVSKKDLKVDDFILHQEQWVRVIDFDEARRPIVEKIFSKEVVTIMPTKNLFGFDFYTKLMAFDFDSVNMGASEDNPFGGMLPLMMMSNEGGGNMKEIFLMMMMSGNLTDINPMIAYFMMSDKSDNKDMLPMLLMMNPIHKKDK